MAHKLVYLVWTSIADRAANRDLLVGRCGPRLLSLGAARLIIHAADPGSAVRSPVPWQPKDPPRIDGMVSLWLDDIDGRGAFEAALREAGCRVAGYLVEESIYREYGGNRHASARDWPDGERSPGIAQITLMERPRRLTRDEWIRRWHCGISPVSEAIQPRARYVRNLVVRPLTDGAPGFEGIVEEVWPSARHLTNPLLFYGASGPVSLVVNLARILRAVTAFLDLRRIRVAMTGEYFLATGAPPEG